MNSVYEDLYNKVLKLSSDDGNGNYFELAERSADSISAQLHNVSSLSDSWQEVSNTCGQVKLKVKGLLQAIKQEMSKFTSESIEIELKASSAATKANTEATRILANLKEYTASLNNQ